MWFALRFLVAFGLGLPGMSVLGFEGDPDVGQSSAATKQGAAEFSKKVKVMMGTKEPEQAYEFGAYFGELPSGKSGVVTVVLVNPNPFSIPIKSLRSSSGFTHARLRSNEIPASGEAELEVNVKTPVRHRTRTFQGRVDLEVDREKAKSTDIRRVGINLSFDIVGMLCFTDSMRVLVVSEEGDSFAIPFVSTLNGKPRSALSVSASGALEGVQGEVVSDGESTAVVISIDEDMTSAMGAPGKITLSHRKTGVSDSIEVVLLKKDAVRVSPLTLRFVQGRDGRYVANAVLQFDVNGSSGEGVGDKATKRSLFCEAFIDSHKLSVSSQSLSSTTHRIRVTLPDADGVRWSELESKLKLTWNIVANDQRYVLNSPFRVLSRDN